MACGQIIGSLNGYSRLTALSTSQAQIESPTDWFMLGGMQARAWISLLAEVGDGVLIRPAVQYVQVVTDQPSGNGGRTAWSGLGTAVGTPAYARIMARISSASGVVTADQLVVNVQVM